MLNENGKGISSEGICDFCSSPDLFYGYLACDFIAAELVVPDVATYVLNSLGAWMACRECTRLIEGKQWEELLERAFRTFHDIHGSELNMTAEDERMIREFLWHLHAQFRKFQVSRTPAPARRPSLAGVN